MTIENQVRTVAWKKWLGIGLIGLSGIWFALLLLAPFGPFSIEMKALLALLFLALMEISFWLGTIILGKQALSKFWSFLKNKRSKTM
jgi:hypothetical protein